MVPVGEGDRVHRPEVSHLGEEREGIVAVIGSPRAERFGCRHGPLLVAREPTALLLSLRRGTMFIDVPDESTADAEVADWYERQRAAWGFLPNYAPAFATRPDVAE